MDLVNTSCAELKECRIYRLSRLRATGNQTGQLELIYNENGDKLAS